MDCEATSIYSWSAIENGRFDGHEISLDVNHEKFRVFSDDSFLVGMLQIYAFDLYDAPSHLPLRPSPAALDSVDSFQTINTWIQVCRSSHVNCQQGETDLRHITMEFGQYSP
jgi:hypothetical protein